MIHIILLFIRFITFSVICAVVYAGVSFYALWTWDTFYIKDFTKVAKEGYKNINTSFKRGMKLGTRKYS